MTVLARVSGVVFDVERWEEIYADLRAAVDGLPAEFGSGTDALDLSVSLDEDGGASAFFHGHASAQPRGVFEYLTSLESALRDVEGVGQLSVLC